MSRDMAENVSPPTINGENDLSDIKFPSKSTSQYQMKPNIKEGFQGSVIKEIISNVLLDVLDASDITYVGKQYSSTETAEWTSRISDCISERVKDLNMRRYKHIVQVLIVQQTGAGCRYIARCRWDAECDSQVSNYFTNDSMACIVTVFGVFLY